jgi:hypothetical protein
VRDSFRIVEAQSTVISLYYVGIPGALAFLLIGSLDYLDMSLADRHAEIIILFLLANAGYSILCRISGRRQQQERKE